MNQQISVEELTRQQTAVTARLGSLQVEIETRTAEMEAADKSLDEAIRAELRGIATAADLAGAQAALNQARTNLDSARRLHHLARQESMNLERELLMARAHERSVLQQRVQSLSDAIEGRIKKDSKLRAELLQIYGLWAAFSVKEGGADWDLIVSGLFAAPTDEEHQKALATGFKQLGIEA